MVYAIGILSCVFHFANGIWTAGITWGVWTSRAAQRRASVVVSIFGVGLGIVALSALTGMTQVDIQQAQKIEDRMERAKEFIDGQAADPSGAGPASGGETSQHSSQQQSGVAVAGDSRAK